MEIMVIPPSFHISLQQLGTALQNFAGVFCSLIRSHLAKKENKENQCKTHHEMEKKKFSKKKSSNHMTVWKNQRWRPSVLKISRETPRI